MSCLPFTVREFSMKLAFRQATSSCPCPRNTETPPCLFRKLPINGLAFYWWSSRRPETHMELQPFKIERHVDLNRRVARNLNILFCVTLFASILQPDSFHWWCLSQLSIANCDKSRQFFRRNPKYKFILKPLWACGVRGRTDNWLSYYRVLARLHFSFCHLKDFPSLSIDF